jgi:DNA polymerase III delta prime subunit
MSGDAIGLGEVLIDVERELRQLVWKADRLQDTLGELVAKAGERLDHAAIEEAQAIDYISQRLTRLARTVAQAAAALGATSAQPPRARPSAGDYEAF